MSSKELVDSVTDLRTKVDSLKAAKTESEVAEKLSEIESAIQTAKECSTKVEKEVATVSQGARVSWSDHLGRFSGVVEEVHYTKVSRPVRLMRAYNDMQDHTVTRFGTYKNPALYIRIEGNSLEEQDAGMALICLRDILQVDEDPNNGMGS